MDGLPPKEPTHECIVEAAERYAVPVRLIYSILRVEGGKVGQKVYNKNGSYDMGPMQINSVWIPTFSSYVSPTEILYDGCVNVLVGTWLLRSHINLAGDFWQGVGNYHSKTPLHHERYVKKVYGASFKVRPYHERAGTRSER